MAVPLARASRELMCELSHGIERFIETQKGTTDAISTYVDSRPARGATLKIRGAVGYRHSEVLGEA